MKEHRTPGAPIGEVVGALAVHAVAVELALKSAAGSTRGLCCGSRVCMLKQACVKVRVPVPIHPQKGGFEPN